MMIFRIIGINSVFAIFQDFYTSPESKIPSACGNDAVVALVGTLGRIFVNLVIARVKSVKLIALGLFLASYCSSLWQLFLMQLYAIGSSLYYFPIMSIAPTYFHRHRGFAMGCILSGAGAGGLVMAPVLQVLLDRYGIRGALRILATWNFAVGVPIACVIRRRSGFDPTANGVRTRINLGLAKRGIFLYQVLSVLSYSRSGGGLLLAINSGVNSVSRIAMGLLADRAFFLSSLSVFALWYDAARERFIAFVAMYGIYACGYNGLIPTTITEIYGVEKYSRVNGFIYFRGGGAPIELGGQLRARYEHVVVYDGLLLFCAGMCVAYVRWLDACDKGDWKWKA
ncbi:major facilitator superfamily domain-containing protein [Mycena epipterygia]|nr:major facilitator superfamily domain-containing protein [Mycena epipterygia]